VRFLDSLLVLADEAAYYRFAGGAAAGRVPRLV
jgi:hypothetical protein